MKDELPQDQVTPAEKPGDAIHIKVNIDPAVEYAARLCESHAANWKMMAHTGKHKQPGMKFADSRAFCLRNYEALMMASKLIRENVSRSIDKQIAEIIQAAQAQPQPAPVELK